MNRREKIKKALEEKNNFNAVRLQMLNRQKRLKKLVDQYGIEDVALAGGYAESTLKQYLRVSNPMNIGEQALLQAESVFRNIK